MLELKHIVPYLPYGLEIEILNYQCDYVGIRYCILNGFYMLGDSPHFTYQKGSTGKSFSEFKPILRPMSDLTRAELEVAGFSDHIDWLTNEFDHWVETYGLDQVISETPSGHIQYLFTNHFDVFGLIDQKLAISIHDIPKTEK